MNTSIHRRLFLLACAALVCVAGCSPPAERRETVSNPHFTVDRLFTDENGYAVYRFWDKGDYRYYVVGPNGAQMMPKKTREDSSEELLPASSGTSAFGGGHHSK